VKLVDLSHVIEHGLETYRGLPPPVISDFMSREGSRSHYAPGTEFQIGRIEMVANTGTYLDSPFHRHADGADLAGLPLERLAELDGFVVGRPYERARATDAADLAPLAGVAVKGGAVLIHTGFDVHWRSERYFTGHPFLTEAAARLLVHLEVALVGIDSLNIDDTGDGRRPVHTLLLGAAIPVVEHLTNLAALPDRGFRFSAVPPKVKGFGTFPVRAFASVA
jgi:kynurenine formamidase